MTDYIRQAVELAEGWEWSDDLFPHHPIWPPWYDTATHEYGASPKWQHIKDALAMQLARQVDALGVVFASDSNLTAWVGLSSDGCEAFQDGEDRTMNIIRAVVDSGALK